MTSLDLIWLRGWLICGLMIIPTNQVLAVFFALLSSMLVYPQAGSPQGPKMGTVISERKR